MDGLCELTARMHHRKVDFEIPERDYDDDVQGGVKLERSSAQNMMENPEDFDSDENAGSLTPEQIRSMMSREQKDLQRDLKIMHKRGTDFQSKRPEFKVKHHAIMSRGMQRKESKEAEESELNTKLKSRTDKIQQAEDAKKVEENKPEFMKVSLKKGKASQQT